MSILKYCSELIRKQNVLDNKRASLYSICGKQVGERIFKEIVTNARSQRHIPNTEFISREMDRVISHYSYSGKIPKPYQNA